MLISKTKTCGGRHVLTATLSKGISKNMLPELEKIGFIVDKNFLKIGLMRIQKDGIIINGSYNQKIISVLCSNKIDDQDCDKLCNSTIETIQNFVISFK